MHPGGAKIKLVLVLFSYSLTRITPMQDGRISIKATVFGRSERTSDLSGPWSASLEEAVAGFLNLHQKVAPKRGVQGPTAEHPERTWDLYSFFVAVECERAGSRDSAGVDYREDPLQVQAAEDLLGGQYRVVS